VRTPPPAAPTRPVRIGGSVHPNTAIVVAAGEWVWTIAPTSVRRA
jgi:hypothetical protein